MKRLAPCVALLMVQLAAAGELRDPTRAPQAAAHAAAARKSGPVLSAILVSGNRRGAIFEGQFVRAGGRVAGYTIVAVLKAGVLYRYAGQTIELDMPSATASIKQPSLEPARLVSGVTP